MCIRDRYERLCRQNNLVDFGELLLRFYETLKNNDPLLKHYQNRFENILVDEFQDTNEIQYQIIKLITGSEGRAFIVGDDDQSIYRWRGANPDSMPRFRNDFLDPRSIKLEQNYRSTKNILEAAQNLILVNKQRLEGELFTDNPKGKPVVIAEAYTEEEEAQAVLNEISRINKEEQFNLRDCVVTYRINAQSRAMEEACLRNGIPYKLIGGVRFYQRKEVKDILAYLRLLLDPFDEVSLIRIINMPARGIGKKTIEDLRLSLIHI